jgi:hypothetical protein
MLSPPFSLLRILPLILLLFFSALLLSSPSPLTSGRWSYLSFLHCLHIFFTTVFPVKLSLLSFCSALPFILRVSSFLVLLMFLVLVFLGTFSLLSSLSFPVLLLLVMVFLVFVLMLVFMFVFLLAVVVR